VLVDDVGTTGLSLLNAIKSLKDAKMVVIAAFVIVNRSEGARELLASENVNCMRSLMFKQYQISCTMPSYLMNKPMNVLRNK